MQKEYTPFGWTVYGKKNIKTIIQNPKDITNLFSKHKPKSKSKSNPVRRGGNSSVIYNIKDMMFGFEYETLVQVIIDHTPIQINNTTIQIINMIHWMKKNPRSGNTYSTVTSMFLIAIIISIASASVIEVVTTYHGEPFKTYDYMEIDAHLGNWTITKDSSVKLNTSTVYQSIEQLYDDKDDISFVDEQMIENIEIVSPILDWKSVNDGVINSELNKFRAGGIFNYINNSSTSNHIHLSNGDMFKTPKNLVNAVMAWWYYEPVFLSMVGKWRRNNSFCVTMNEQMNGKYGKDNAKYVLDNMNGNNYKEFLKVMQYPEGLSPLDKIIHFFQGDNRYVALNLINLQNGKGTIEVRLKHGSSDGKENTNFILLLAYFFHGIIVNNGHRNESETSDKTKSFFNIIKKIELEKYWLEKIVRLKKNPPNMGPSPMLTEEDSSPMVEGGGKPSTGEYLFSYGSNSMMQLSERLSRKKWKVYPGTMRNYTRIFAGYSKLWGGAVSSVHPLKNGKTNGLVFEITREELNKLDNYETGYRREMIEVEISGNQIIQCNVYIKNNTDFICMPSRKYLDAIRIMLDERSNMKGIVKPLKVLIRSLDNDGKIVVHKLAS
jgi:hypothetical protein